MWASLDFSFLDWNVVSSFVLKGFVYSIQLTLVAMVGGIILGTLLALMRLSGKKWLVLPAAFYVNTLRSIPLVMVILWFFLLIPLLIGAVSLVAPLAVATVVMGGLTVLGSGWLARWVPAYAAGPHARLRRRTGRRRPGP